MNKLSATDHWLGHHLVLLCCCCLISIRIHAISAHKLSRETPQAAAGAQTRLRTQDMHADLRLRRATGPKELAAASCNQRPAQSASSSNGSPSIEASDALKRTRRKRWASAPASAFERHEPLAHALSGQRLIIPCRNYTLLGAHSDRRPAGGQTSAHRRTPALGAGLADSPGDGALKYAGPRQPFNLIVPQTTGVALVVWHKDEQLNAPIYAADARGTGSMREAKQQVMADALKGRAHFELLDLSGSSPGALPALVIEDASLQDSGLYTCTVEFHKAPTQTYVARALVADPPKNMVVRDIASDQQLRSSLAGPYDEDSRLALVCEVEPGQPSAGHVSWWQLDSVTQTGEPARNKQPAAPAHWHPALDERTAYITTVSLDQDYEPAPTSGRATGDSESPAAESQEAPSSGPQSREHFLSAHSSLQWAADSPAPTHAGRLKHWRRVENRTAKSDDGTKLQAFLEIGQLSRANLGDEFLCLATNNHFAPPVNLSLSLDLNLRPTEVRIKSKSNGTFELGQKTVIECHALGSRPSAQIKWFRGSEEIDTSAAAPDSNDRPQSDLATSSPVSEFNRDINNLTKISYLTIVPQLSDNQKQLTCSASNQKIPGAPIQSDSILMSVQFAPKLRLKFGANIRADSIQLASDIFMDCDIESNPPINDLVWLHDGEPLAADVSAGVIMSNQSLVLRHIRVDQRGAYQCLAHNSLGRALSNKLELRPKFAPTCDRKLTRTRYEVPLNQPTRIECHVLAEPGEDLHFTWRFNRTSPSGKSAAGAAADLQMDSLAEHIRQYETNFTQSSIVFTPQSKRHFGQLLCSASNSMGSQEEPCAIQIVQSELPEPVLGCFVDNQTHSSFSIHCQPPAQTPTSSVARGGQTYFILELYANETGAGPAADASLASAQTANQDRRQRQEDSSSSGGSSGAHLRSMPMNDEAEHYPAAASDEAPPDDRNSLPDRGRVQIRRLLSEAPSFNVLDLKPNSSYNILVYVQNSKGRSPPTHHQVSTRPLEGAGSQEAPATSATTSGGGRLELLTNGRESSGQRSGGFVAKVLAYLQASDHGQGDRGARHPFVGITLVVLLSAMSLVLLAFLSSRLLCRAGSKRVGSTSRHISSDVDDGHASGRTLGDEMKRRKSPGNPSAGANSGRAPNPSSSSTCGRLAKNTTTDLNNIPLTTSLAAATRAQAHLCGLGAGGCGSDSSRETNTESTLVSSSRIGNTETIGSDGFSSLRPHSHQCYRPADSLARPASSQARCATAQPQVAAYSTVNRIQAYHQGADVFGPQHPLSVHSSEGSSTNPDNSADLVLSPHSPDHNLKHHHLQQRRRRRAEQPNLLVRHPHDDEGLVLDNVYVIDQHQAGASQQGFFEASSSPACVGAPEGVWYAGGQGVEYAAYRNGQHSDRCHLVNESCGGELALGVHALAGANQQQLPSSFSIPTSLSDRLEVLGRSSSLCERRISLDQLNQLSVQTRKNQIDCRDDSLVSVAAIAPSTSFVTGQQQQQQPELSPPTDFAADYRRFKQTFGIESGAAGLMCPANNYHDNLELMPPKSEQNLHSLQRQQKHRVKFEREPLGAHETKVINRLVD